MHPDIVENLEEFITGGLPPAARRAFEAHLESCPECREEVRGMQEISALFSVLRPEEAIEPPPGFAARVMDRLVMEPAPSFWSIFSLDPGFGRRVAFASLLTLAVLGSYLVSLETEYRPAHPSPEAIMAIEHFAPAPGAPMSDRDRMLVTLTSYEP
jgi:anti-sigma factor RsiW